MEDLRAELVCIRESQIRMEEDIKTHIRRTDLLEALHKDNEGRIEVLEIPVQARKYILSQALLIGKVVGDQFVVLQIKVPIPKNEHERKLYEDMKKEMPFYPRDVNFG